jgi:hypothetical protein
VRGVVHRGTPAGAAVGSDGARLGLVDRRRRPDDARELTGGAGVRAARPSAARTVGAGLSVRLVTAPGQLVGRAKGKRHRVRTTGAGAAGTGVGRARASCSSGGSRAALEGRTNGGRGIVQASIGAEGARGELTPDARRLTRRARVHRRAVRPAPIGAERARRKLRPNAHRLALDA